MVGGWRVEVGARFHRYRYSVGWRVGMYVNTKFLMQSTIQRINCSAGYFFCAGSFVLRMRKLSVKLNGYIKASTTSEGQICCFLFYVRKSMNM